MHVDGSVRRHSCIMYIFITKVSSDVSGSASHVTPASKAPFFSESRTGPIARPRPLEKDMNFRGPLPCNVSAARAVIGCREVVSMRMRMSMSRRLTSPHDMRSKASSFSIVLYSLRMGSVKVAVMDSVAILSGERDRRP